MLKEAKGMKATIFMCCSMTNLILNITYFDDYKGFEDLYSGTVIKLPLKTKKIEIALSPGIYIPLFSNNPKAPENSISFPSDRSTYYTQLSIIIITRQEMDPKP